MDRHDPFESMDRTIEQLRRSMRDLQIGRRPMGLPAGDDDFEVSGGDGLGPATTSVRLEPAEEGYVAIADLPGFEREEITVSFDDDHLSIVADHEASEEDELSVRRHTRRVSESLRVPGEVDVDAISGTYRNGVLEVNLPTEEAPDAHVIDVE